MAAEARAPRRRAEEAGAGGSEGTAEEPEASFTAEAPAEIAASRRVALALAPRASAFSCRWRMLAAVLRRNPWRLGPESMLERWTSWGKEGTSIRVQESCPKFDLTRLALLSAK